MADFTLPDGTPGNMRSIEILPAGSATILVDYLAVTTGHVMYTKAFLVNAAQTQITDAATGTLVAAPPAGLVTAINNAITNTKSALVSGAAANKINP